LYAAKISQENHTGYLVLGNQFWGAVNRGNEQRWRDLTGEVRKIYEIIQGIWNNEYGSYLNEITWGNVLDHIMVGYYNDFADDQDPTLVNLEDAMKKWNTEQFDKLYDLTGTPIIILTPFMSKDYAGKNQWSEPLQANADEVANFDLQARMYEAFFTVTVVNPGLRALLLQDTGWRRILIRNIHLTNQGAYATNLLVWLSQMVFSLITD
jgi:hypothetical protein